MPAAELKVYQPVWRCIYCGDNTNPRKLQKEHIVPLSFGGNLVLPKASCRKCGSKTREFEEYCARTIYGKLRIKRGLPTRHPDQRPTHLPLDIKFRNKIERRNLPVADYPDIPIQFPIFQPPGIVRGVKRSDTFEKVLLKILAPRYPDLHKNYQRIKPPDAIAFRQQINFRIFPFARLLAKIAHSYAVAELGTEAFSPLLPKLILGEDNTLPYFVGSAPNQGAVTYGPNVIHNLNVCTRTIRDRTYVSVLVHLFPHFMFPEYEVITGKVDQRQEHALLDRAQPK